MIELKSAAKKFYAISCNEGISSGELLMGSMDKKILLDAFAKYKRPALEPPYDKRTPEQIWKMVKQAGEYSMIEIPIAE